MTQLLHRTDTHADSRPEVAFVGTYPPRRCGIATFTEDLLTAVGPPAWVVAIEDTPDSRCYPPEVRFILDQHDPGAYLHAADRINEGASLASIQHEFGIFGGPSGADVLTLVEALRVPLVTTLHTVTSDPNDEQRAIVRELAGVSARLVVMSQVGRSLLRTAYAVDEANVAVIPHGIPPIPRESTATARSRLGLEDRTVMLSFGLLSPSKGFEQAIAALPDILEVQPNFLYLIAGATHPDEIQQHGEAYRESLHVLAQRLGVGEHVRFVNRYLPRPALYELLAACDFYITPYPNMEQISSGTLSYAMGAGAVVLSTPYWHARELLDDGRGQLIAPDDPSAIATAVRDLLRDDRRREDMRERAYAWSGGAIWPAVGARYRALFAEAAGVASSSHWKRRETPSDRTG